VNAFIVLCAVAAAAAADAGDAALLQQLWSGGRDSSEQVVMNSEREPSLWLQMNERRVRTVAAPVAVPWLGAHVLYLEEFLEDEPQQLRRQLLLQLQADAGQHAVLVRVYSFARPSQWTHLNHRPERLAALARSDLVPAAGCDLVMTRTGDQFRGGTQGRGCLDVQGGRRRYLDYQLLISADLYWYRRRLLRESDGELQQEVIGFNRFEPDEARLYACGISWSAAGHARDQPAFVTLDLYEQGGRGHFVTPDGRSLAVTLHGRDWPFAVDRDALLLMLQEDDHPSPLATAWSQMDHQQISLDLGWLAVRCAALAPDSDEVAQ
jgi:CpeT/CpcT family (DUF1001)